MSVWDDVKAYDLRHLPAHLAAAGRWDDLAQVVFETAYLRVGMGRLGLQTLVELLSEVADGRAVPRRLAIAVRHLGAILTEEAGFLTRDQYLAYEAPFANQLTTAALYRGDRDLLHLLWTDLQGTAPAGWLDTEPTNGLPILVRYFVPGERASYGWDTYDAGPAGVHVAVAVDVRRARLLVESVDQHYDSYASTQPVRYHWRIWDLRSGVLLLERESRADTRDRRGWAPEADWSETGRPAAFNDPALLRGRKRWGGGDASPPLAATRQLSVVSVIIRCENGAELLCVGRDTAGTPRAVLARQGARTRVREVVLPDDIEPQMLVHVGDRLLVLGLGQDRHVYRLDIGDAGAAFRSSAHDQSAGPRRERDREGPPITLEPAPPGTGPGVPHDHSLGFVLGPESCRVVVEQRFLSLRVWSRQGGRWLGALAATDQFYGGGGVLAGCALTPDGGRVVSAAQGRTLVVWELDGLSGGRGPSPLGLHQPDWKITGVSLTDPVTHVTFLWGGWLLAAVTEAHELLVLNFWSSSSVLARVGLAEPVRALTGETYGAGITCTAASGRTMRYVFRHLPGSGVSALEGRRLVARLQRADATAVAVAGTFTGWKPHPLRSHRNGIWEALFDLEPGEHEYKFVIDGTTWVVDPHLPFRPGPYGENSYVTVR